AQAFSERLLRLFEHHLSENLSAVAIAAKLGISVRTLTKRCQEVAGRPPARAFMRYKMEYAARALRQSEMTIKAISHRPGFQNQSAMTFFMPFGTFFARPSLDRRPSLRLGLLATAIGALLPSSGAAAEPNLQAFHRDIQPVLEKYCYDCHGGGVAKGGVTLD